MRRAEAGSFLDAACEFHPEFYPLFLMAIRAGLRKGELLAVKWGDIQFGANEDDPNWYILVQRNYVHRKFTTPKSKKSRRSFAGTSAGPDRATRQADAGSFYGGEGWRRR